MSAQDPLPPTDALQQQLEPPLAKLHIPDAIAVAPNVALPSNATVWTKLYLLLHAHQLAASASRMLLIWRLVMLAVCLFVAIPLGVLAGVGIGSLVYEHPYSNAQSYNQPGGFHTYYIRGKEVSQPEYDYYLRNGSNEGWALVAGVPVGIFVGLLVLGILWLFLRPRKPPVLLSVEQQIAEITKAHPDAVASWGGVAVLRVPQLIERLLDMHAKEVRR